MPKVDIIATGPPLYAARRNIILMSSVAARLVSQASAAYGAAHAATLMLMLHLAQELDPFGIWANALAPSIVRNERIEKFSAPEMQAKATRLRALRVRAQSEGAL